MNSDSCKVWFNQVEWSRHPRIRLFSCRPFRGSLCCSRSYIRIGGLRRLFPTLASFSAAATSTVLPRDDVCRCFIIASQERKKKHFLGGPLLHAINNSSNHFEIHENTVQWAKTNPSEVRLHSYNPTRLLLQQESQSKSRDSYLLSIGLILFSETRKHEE